MLTVEERDEGVEESKRLRYDEEGRYRSSSRHRHHHHHPHYDRRSHSRHNSRSSRYPEEERYARSGRYDEEDRHVSRHSRYDRRDRQDDRRSRRYERERERDRYRGRDQDPHRYQTDPSTREYRTVFVTQIAQRLTDEQLGEFFTQAGRVKGAKIVIDKVTRRSKGVAYVEFYEQESVAKALELAGQKLLGIPVIVQPSEAEKNRLAAEQAAAARAHASGRESATALPLGTPKAEMFNRVFIGGIHYNLSEDDIQLVFKPFGNLTEVRLEQDETGRSKGYGFLRYERSEDARTAVERMNGFQLAGRFIKRRFPSSPPSSSPPCLLTLCSLHMHDLLGGGMIETAGVQMTAKSRIELMQKLSRNPQTQKTGDDGGQHEGVGLGAETSPHPSSSSRPSSALPPMPQISRCIVLRHMFSTEDQNEPQWDTELEQDVRDEAGKFGLVVHAHVDEDSEQGEVYVKFAEAEGANRAIKALDGRWFAQKRIEAVPVPEVMYHTRFPKSASS
ncbi:MAG: hypothetical protein DHS80DRAFT_27603 [Piptocephalis tieghemiana]|nr:MAG: hypothetical protein DHS80DRAFT_27603 [Piptocephalis tieghemiana]